MLTPGARLLSGVFAFGMLAVITLYLVPRVQDRDSRTFRLLAKVTRWVPTILPQDAPAGNDTMLGPQWTGWTWVNRAHVHDPISAQDSLLLRSRQESVWWMNRRGPFLYQRRVGDFGITANVSARRESDPDHPPDREWQFAGIMVRDPRGRAVLSLENYVFIVVGHRGDRLQVEYKSTRDGLSDVSAIDWDSGDAKLRIVRAGATISVEALRKDQERWLRLADYDRPDLPEVVQVGLILYAYSEGRGVVDLQGVFRDVAIGTVPRD